MKPTQAQIEAATEAIRLNWMTRGIGPAALAKAALTAANEADLDKIKDVVCERDMEIEDLKTKLAAEREACAQVAENFVGEWDSQKKAIAAAIRARGEK